MAITSAALNARNQPRRSHERTGKRVDDATGHAASPSSGTHPAALHNAEPGRLQSSFALIRRFGPCGHPPVAAAPLKFARVPQVSADA
jgi:hypothetical protein